MYGCDAPQTPNIPPLKPLEPTPQKVPELKESYIQDAAKSAVEDYEKVLGLKLPENTVSNIVLISKLYESQELHDVVYNFIHGNNPQSKGVKLESKGVSGAKIRATANGAKMGYYESLEEAEATLIGKFIRDRGERPKTAKMINAQDMNIENQYILLNDLLTRIGQGFEENVQNLAKLRNQKGGREKFCQILGQQYNLPVEDHLLFSMSVLATIDNGDRNTYSQLLR